MNLEGRLTRLRALEPADAERMYAWENDPAVWGVSGTLAPFSRHTIERFIEEQRFEIFQSGRQRLVIETLPATEAVGTLDLFDLDPVNGRAGVGILVCGAENRRKGYAADALATLCRYARETLLLHQLWCNIGADNAASLALFRSAGFVDAGLKREWQRTAEGYTDEIFLQKILG